LDVRVATLATTTYAVFLATCFTWAELVDALARAMRIVLALSLLFEALLSLSSSDAITGKAAFV